MPKVTAYLDWNSHSLQEEIVTMVERFYIALIGIGLVVAVVATAVILLLLP